MHLRECLIAFGLMELKQKQANAQRRTQSARVHVMEMKEKRANAYKRMNVLHRNRRHNDALSGKGQHESRLAKEGAIVLNRE